MSTQPRHTHQTSAAGPLRSMRGLLAGAAVLSLSLGAALAVFPATPVAAAIPVGCALNTSTTPLSVDCDLTADTIFTVPAGVDRLRVVVSGGAGAANWTRGGSGATVTADLPVTGGNSLNVSVGANGGSGEGGGASDIRTGSAISTALVVAGGGGAGGTAGGGGVGGSAGITFTASCAPGSAGTNASTPPGRGGSGTGGAGGTCVGGGAGGTTGGGTGVAGAGGAYSAIGNRGGGGGAGYFGGGGGGGWAGTGASNGGGGGGGSSYLAGGATLVSSVANTSRTASVRISYSVEIASMTITPVSTAATIPPATTFSVEGFDSSGGSLGDLTALALFSISAGTCTGAVCTGEVGTQTVTATIGSVSDQYSFTTAAAPVDVVAPADPAEPADTGARTLAEGGYNIPVGLLVGAGVAVVAGAAAFLIDARRRQRARSAG